ncbi:MAG: c-type cytochrome domain-containing protein, partial [Verrucomicrobiales bacterium]
MARTLTGIATVLSTVCGVSDALAESHAEDPAAFLGTYCYSCHGEEKQKGDRRFDQLAFPIDSETGIVEAQEIIDQLTLGEMP